MSPARVTEVEIDEAENKATVSVPEDQLSLAIGKDGQNVRLANKLTKWKIDIKGMKGFFESEPGKEKSTSQTSQVKKESKPSLGIWDEVIAKTRTEMNERKAAEEAAKAEAESSEAVSEIENSEESSN